MSDEMSIITPRLPRGFVELLPKDQIVFNQMLVIIKEVYERFGYLPIETPAVELKEVLLAKGGGETEKQVYRLATKTGETDMCLHFDLTVPLARYVAQHINELAFPFRRYQMQKVWRGETAQRGRYREFYQCDIDVIGARDPMTDAEIPSVIYSVFTKLGLKDFTIHISNRKILNGYLEAIGLRETSGAVLRAVDKMDAKDLSARLQEAGLDNVRSDDLMRLITLQGANNEVLTPLKEWPLENDLFEQGVAELALVTDGIRSLGVPERNFSLDMSIVRGLDYYTGTVYETRLDDYPKLGSVCSGGRYDNLCGFYIDRDLPGVGISIGLSRLFFQLKEAGLLPHANATTARVMIALADRSSIAYALEVAKDIRHDHINCEVYLEEARIRKQMEYAGRLGIPYVIIIGADEVAKKMVSLKDMAKAEQKLVTLEMAIAIIRWERDHS